MMNFGDAPTTQKVMGELIPDKTLAWAMVTVRPHNIDQGFIEVPPKSNPNNAYLDLELTIVDGPFAGRKVWDMVGIKGKDEYVQMGRAAIRHMLETGRRASPSNPAGYQIPDYMGLDQLRVAVEIGIEKGKGDYKDKNRVRRYLSPNPESDTNKAFQALMGGQSAPPAAPAAPAAPAWGGGAPAQQGGKPAWVS